MPNIAEGEIKDTSEVRSLVHNLWTEVAQLRDELRGTKQMKPVSSFVDPTTRRVSMHDPQSKTTKEENLERASFVSPSSSRKAPPEIRSSGPAPPSVASAAATLPRRLELPPVSAPRESRGGRTWRARVT